MREDFLKLVGEQTETDTSLAIQEAMKCMDDFARAFEGEDLAGMDDCCHFPHIIISKEQVIVWEAPGQIGADFFRRLKESGFARTVVTRREPVVVSAEKVHVLYSYQREDVQGRIMSSHENMWILTQKDGCWKILLRSYS